jgi:2-polyprenyl-6-methoxyphenol hydroxylase-like FAD-dependent oxidoreductase
MPAVNRVLVVGAGAAGTAAAIVLAEAGVAVDLVEVKPDVTAIGSGITLQGNALRVMRRLGVWEAARAQGYCFDTLGIRAPDPAGTLVMEIPDARLGGPDLPATMGMYRPDLPGCWSTGRSRSAHGCGTPPRWRRSPRTTPAST